MADKILLKTIKITINNCLVYMSKIIKLFFKLFFIIFYKALLIKNKKKSILSAYLIFNSN